MNFKLWLLAGLMVDPMSSHAQQSPDSTPQVVIDGTQTDIETGRDFVAGKKIISRKRIEESGLPTVEELLKRDPAVSVAADGRIGLLGMPGYTQVLVDGNPPPAGRSLQLELIHVEKIEIIKSAVAEYGPYGIAGTINIITRKASRKTHAQIIAGASTAHGMPAANIALSHNQSTSGSPVRLSGRLGASEKRASHQSTLAQAIATDEQAEQVQWLGLIRGRQRFITFDGSGDVQWQINPAHALSFTPNGGRFNSYENGQESRSWASGEQLDTNLLSRSSLSMISAPLKWSFKPSRNSQAEANWTSMQMRAASRVMRVDTSDALARTARDRNESSAFDANTLSVTYKARAASGHDMKIGATVRNEDKRDRYVHQIDDAPDPALATLGEQRRSKKKQHRIFLQDDWRLSDQLAVNLGITGEKSAFKLTEAGYVSCPDFRSWSPSAHLSRKVGGSDAHQFRFSIARTFRAPDVDSLALRPVLHPLAPCDRRGACGANTIDTPDTAGNPGLQPERSLGVNLSYEHGVGADSQITVEFFSRRIDRKIGTNIALENVPWSAVARYVARPVNLGKAQAEGINVEMELALRDMAGKSSPKMDFRGSFSFARSRISTLPGPDDRLDGQTPWSAKIGATYKPANLPLKFDVDANWTPQVWTRTSITQRAYLAHRFELDAGAAWTISAGKRVHFNFRNLAARPSRRIDEFASPDGRIRLAAEAARYTTFALRFESTL